MNTGDTITQKSDQSAFKAFIGREWVLGLAFASCLIAALFEHQLLTGFDNYFKLAVVIVWLFGTILMSAIGVVRHAEAISERLGEPYGTLVLTLSITGIEVMSITAVMLHGADNPSLVRDTLFSVVMIIMGGMVGMALLLGAFRHKELTFNLQGAKAYLGVIIPLAVFSLVLPDFTKSTDGPTLSALQKIMVGSMAAGLFFIFLLIQTGRHRLFFIPPTLEEEEAQEEQAHEAPYPLGVSVLMLFLYIAPVVFLVEELAKPIDYLIETLHVPTAIGGVMMAILVTTPEGIGGVKAALNNRLQQSVNIFLGSVLATIGLTVPTMMVVSSVLGLDLVLGLSSVDILQLLLIFTVSILTFSSDRTHMLQGAVHFLIFIAFLMLLYRG